MVVDGRWSIAGTRAERFCRWLILVISGGGGGTLLHGCMHVAFDQIRR